MISFFIPKNRKRQEASINGTRKWCFIYWCQLIGGYRRSAHGLQLFSLAEKRDSLGSSPRNKDSWPLGQGLLVDKRDLLSSISMPQPKTRPDSPVPSLQGTLRSESEIRGTLRFLPQLEMRPSSNALVFPAVSVEYSEVLRSKKGAKWTEREWKVGVDENKVRKAKFCRRLQSGCLQVVDVFPTGEYLKKVKAEQKKLDEKKNKLKKTA